MELALGTAQFGLAYGIAGRRSPMPEDEAGTILMAAADAGVRMLDTAAAYGDIEERLAGLCQGFGFSVVSKIPPVPHDLDKSRQKAWAVDCAMRSKKRLGAMLKGLMFHDVADLMGEDGAARWEAVRAWGRDEGIDIGVSLYGPGEAALPFRNEIEIAQLPANALDQRIAAAPSLLPPSCAVFLRSIFLQGLLPMPLAESERKLPAAVPALKRWHEWCAARHVSPLEGALAVAKSFPASYAVVGVDDLAQFRAILAAWKKTAPLAALELAVENAEIIDPRRWPK
jgi:aryl-alcohol dehydrogenase-like predicted oxidoreductase